MKKLLVFSFFLTALNVATFAQNNGFNRNIRIGYSHVGGAIEGGYIIYDHIPIYSGSMLSVDADLLKLPPRLTLSGHIEFGGAATRELDTAFFTITPTIGVHYGIDASYHVLDASIDSWDVRINGSLGSYWCPGITPQAECGLGIIAAYYPLKHFGIYGELAWGHYLYNQLGNYYVGFGNSKMKVGIAYRF